jgi:hypothetical protein
METTDCPTIEVLLNSTDHGPYEQKIVENWRLLSPQLRAMVPHVAQLIVEGMGGAAAWLDMTDAEHNIMSYTAVFLLAEARMRAAGQISE